MENTIHIKISRQQLYKTAALILLGNLFFLLSTYYLYFFYYQVPSNKSLILNLSYFNLAQENTFGTCYSAWLLLMVAIVAAFCFIADQQEHRHRPGQILSYGWLFFSTVFCLLSLDEVGSFHERLGNTATFNLFGEAIDWYLFHSLVSAVAVFMLFFCWKRLRSNIPAVVLFLTGLLLFVSLRFQENYEMAHYSKRRPVFFILFEEGTELFGALCFLTAMTWSLIYLLNKKEKALDGTLIDLKFNLPPKFALAGTFAFLFLLALGQLFIKFYFRNFAQADKGIPENWFPGMVAFLGGIMCLGIFFNKTKTATTRPLVYFFTGIYCLLLSFIYGSNFYLTYFYYKVGWYPLVLKIIMGGGAIGLGLFLMQRIKSIWNWAGIVSWVSLFCFSLTINGNYFARVGFIAFGCLLLTLIYHIYFWQNKAAEVTPLLNSRPLINY